VTELCALLCGLIFGTGLIVSGMSDPAKVLGFLDLGGDWDPSLALVMVGAVAVAVGPFAWARRRGRDLFGVPLDLPRNDRIDRRLLLGSVLFGTGWGLAGICPGPALVGLGSGFLPGAICAVCIALGLKIGGLWLQPTPAGRSATRR
jgi:uncharacterized membrane protein YedE/YeeE